MTENELPAVLRVAKRKFQRVAGTAENKIAVSNDFDEPMELIDAVKLEALNNRIAELEDALRVIERRLRENTQPIVELINKEIARGELSELQVIALREAWKGGVYSSAIRAQIMLGDMYAPTAPPHSDTAHPASEGGE